MEMSRFHAKMRFAIAGNARSCIITHSKAASFSIKTILCENTNILFSNNYWKLGKNEC